MKNFINWIILALVGIFTVVILFNTTDPQKLLELLGTVKGSYLIMGVLALFIYILLEAIMLHLLLNHKAEHKHSFNCALKATFIGQYFNLITPCSSGGQPMQLHGMIEDGISAKQGTAVLINKFLVFQLGVTLYSLFLVLVHLVFLHTGLPTGNGIVYVGITINLLGLAGVIASIYFPIFFKKIVAAVIHALHVIKVIKRGQYWIDWIDNKIDDYTEHIREMIEMKKVMIPVSLLTIIQLTAYFSICWFVYLAMGLTGTSFIEIIMLQSILFVSVSFIPTPGSAGVAEGGFYLLFSEVFSSSSMAGAILLWRGISYYLTIIVTGILTLIVSMKRVVKS